jgi:hypothetical protein
MTNLKIFVNLPLTTAVVRVAAICIASTLAVGGAWAQAPKQTYKCNNNHYTDSLTDPKAIGCKPLEGGNVTIVQGTKVQTGAAPSTGTAPVRVANAPQAGTRIEGAEQRSRDSDSRSILESELKKAEAKQAELLKEYNNGEPEKRGGEAQNHQKYIDRVAEMKASIARNDSDIAGIRRELGRSVKSAKVE